MTDNIFISPNVLNTLPAFDAAAVCRGPRTTPFTGEFSRENVFEKTSREKIKPRSKPFEYRFEFDFTTLRFLSPFGPKETNRSGSRAGNDRISYGESHGFVKQTTRIPIQTRVS